MLWTFVLGGAAAAAILIWRFGLIKLLAASARHVLLMMRLASWLPLSEEERRRLQPPLCLAPAAVPAVVIVVCQLV
jgi:hypothetical protein